MPLRPGITIGCIAHLPEGAVNFTTVELKSNFLGTAQTGTIACVARPAHLGRNTQVWDATVIHRETGKTIALFRCTQNEIGDFIWVDINLQKNFRYLTVLCPH